MAAGGDVPLGQGDLAPSLKDILLIPDPNDPRKMVRPDLTGATVVLKMHPVGCQVPALGGAGVVVDAKDAVVQYDWQVPDTRNAGEFDARWVVTPASGRPYSVPNSGYIRVVVSPK